MTDHVLDALVMRRDELTRKLAARTGQPGFGQNVQEIEEAIGQLTAEIEAREASLDET